MVRIERLLIVLLGIALLRAWWKLYKGKVKRWLECTKDHMPLWGSHISSAQDFSLVFEWVFKVSPTPGPYFQRFNKVSDIVCWSSGYDALAEIEFAVVGGR